MIYSPPKYEKNLPSVNNELYALEGELDDRTAKITLIKFLRANLAFTCELICGIKLRAFQEIILKGLFNRNYSMCVMARGAGKSFLAAVFCILYCIFNPGTKVVIAGPTFRTARNIFTELQRMVKSKGAELLAQAFDSKPSLRSDLFTWEINGGSITAIPLSGEKIRGFRAHVLILDEFLLLTEDIVETVLMPFLVANADMTERVETKEKEDELIKLGVMKEEDRTVFEDNIRMIALSSASYTFEYLYKRYCAWREMIYNHEKQSATYFIAQIAYNGVPEGMMSKNVIEEAETGGINSPNFLREYGAQFVDGNDGYFSAKKMEECTLKVDQAPHLTLVGEKDKQYVLSIDPNFNASQTADHFAMCVMEYDEKTGYGTVVHQYANCEADLKDNIKYFYYILTHFNVVFIYLDFAGGRRFIDAANLSEYSREYKKTLSFFELGDEEEGEAYSVMLKAARNQYNLLDGRICIERTFNTIWIRKANEYLQSNINYRRITFGSKIRPSDIVSEKVLSQKVDVSKLNFPGNSAEEIISEAIDQQDYLIKLVKDECALIEVDTSVKGSQSFDLPQHLRRDRSPTRARKDSYTALKLGNWACKCYHELMNIKEEEAYQTFTPRFIG